MSKQEIMKGQSKEKMMEALYEYAASCHIENILTENPIKKTLDFDISPSPEFESKMKRIIAKHERKAAITIIKERSISYLPKAAIFLFVLLGSLTILVANVEALKTKALNLILNIQDQYTSIKINSDEINNQKQQYYLEIQDWNGYLPSYIPDGFNVVKTEQRERFKVIHYLDQQGRTIRFTQYLGSNTDLRIDTEDANVKTIFIDNSEALLAEKQGLISIIWKGEYLFSLIGEADEAEMVKMADSINNK